MQKVDISVQELVNKVQRGELTLPEMQRRYIWPATRVRDLLDSLYRGYPSGAILVWETEQDIKDRQLAIAPTKGQTTNQKLLLLDGQQRITSLSAVISGQPVHVRHRKKPIDILFNLEHPEGPPLQVTEVDEEDMAQDLEEIEDEESAERDIQEELRKRTFVVSGKALKNNPLWISVSEVFTRTDSQILKAAGITSNDEKWDKYSLRLQRLRKIADYPYVMHVLEKDKSYEEVTEIFVRVNSLGIKLRGSDLALAQITSRWTGFMTKLESFAKAFHDDEEYIFDSGLPVRMMVAMATKQSKFKTVGKISIERLEQSWNLATKGLFFAVNFLRSNAKVESLSLISSPFLLVPIATLSVLKEEKFSPREEKDLLRWFYLAHMRGHYSMGSSESILDADLSVLFRTKSVAELISQLRSHVRKFEIDSDDISGKGIRSPFFSMMYFVLREREAKDWFTGLSLSAKHLGKSHSLQFHHIFPKALLKNSGFEKKEINEISNMAFIGGRTNQKIWKHPPQKYFDQIVKDNGLNSLTSQLIPSDKSLWDIEN